MRKVLLVRLETGVDGTFGKIRTPSGFEAYSLEKPWRNNQADVSCVPNGSYQVIRRDSPKHGMCYQLLDVPGRIDVQIHSANWEDQLLGCIALGRSIQDVERPDGTKKKGVSSSKDAVGAFEADVDKEPFELVISSAPGLETFNVK